MEKPTFRVTDHAVLRYMERAMGLNVEVVRDHIAAICRGPAGIGAACLRAEGLRFEFANNVVTTITPDDNNLSKTSRARAQHAIQRKKDAYFEEIDARSRRPLGQHRDRPRAGIEPIAIGDPGPVIAGFPAAGSELEQPCEVLPGGLSGGSSGDLDGAQ